MKNITKTERATLKAENEIIEFKTHLNFLRQHDGFRPGQLHLLLGSTSSGKSTLVRSILVDFISSNPDQGVFLYLTEETKHSFRTAMAYDDHGMDLTNLEVYSEQDSEASAEKLLFMLDEAAKSGTRFLIMDNITTCEFYNDRSYDKQSWLVKELKKNLQRNHISCLCIAHTATGAQASSKLIDGDDIRGNRSISNLAEYLYALQKFEKGKQIGQAIRLIKHRNHQPNENIFLLKFNKITKLFNQDLAISFEMFKEMFNARNKL